MKRSIKHLPQRTQSELSFILESVLQTISKCEMVVLFGSYARGGYVLWDERVEFGVHTSYQSDLDIMVIISDSNVRIVEQRLRERVAQRYHTHFADCRHASPQFIVEDINRLNKALQQGQYFFTEVIRDGIKIYDSGRVRLSKATNCSFVLIREFATQEYEIHFPAGKDFLKAGNMHYNDGRYVTGSFQVHQACERFYSAISLVHTNYRPKSHKLDELYASVKSFSRELSAVFPQNTDFERSCYDLLGRAYIEARYNREFAVTEQELNYMLERTAILRDITERLCAEMINSYGQAIAKGL